MESFRFSGPAQRDLDEILGYVARSDGPDRADALEVVIRSAASLLARMPGMGHGRDDLPSSLRVWSVQRWLILYRPETVPLEIVRVLGGWQDVTLRLEESDLD